MRTHVFVTVFYFVIKVLFFVKLSTYYRRVSRARITRSMFTPADRRYTDTRHAVGRNISDSTPFRFMMVPVQLEYDGQVGSITAPQQYKLR